MKLTLTNQPRKLDLGHGVIVTVRPGVSSVIVAAAQNNAISGEKGSVSFAKAVAREAITEWSGPEDEEGNPVDPTPELIDALLDVYPIFAQFELQYVIPAMAVVTEGNV